MPSGCENVFENSSNYNTNLTYTSSQKKDIFVITKPEVTFPSFFCIKKYEM